MKGTGKTIMRLVLLLSCAVAAGYILLVVVYCIPQSRLLKNLGNSVAAIQKDDADLSEVIFGYPGSRLDVFTDGAMLNTALHSNDEGPLRRAVACRQYVYNGRSPAQGFIDYFYPKEPDGENIYIRYWHGFLVVLKPLLLFFNYSDIRMINHMGQMLLVFIALYAMVRRKLYRFIPALLLTYFFLTPIIMPFSLQYSTDFYVGFASFACLILLYDRIKGKDGLLVLFMMTGILTSYMDLLTYPVFTLGLPLAGLLMIRSADRDKKDFLSEFKCFTACGFSWFFGYAGMWASKTIIAIPFYGTGVISDTVNSTMARSAQGAVEEGYSYAEALKANFFMYKNRIYIISLIVYTIVVLMYIIYGRIKGRRIAQPYLIPMFLCIIAIPFVWYLVTIEHACVHSFMTYKDLTVAVIGYCAAAASFIPAADEDRAPERSENQNI